jgi:hypothetical protein
VKAGGPSSLHKDGKSWVFCVKATGHQVFPAALLAVLQAWPATPDAATRLAVALRSVTDWQYVYALHGTGHIKLASLRKPIPSDWREHGWEVV